MGIIGDDHRMDAATISDTVNAASRVEGLTKHFGAKILLSEEVRNKLDDPRDFNLRYLGKVQVKGKQEVINIYECFDGDSEEMIELKKATLIDFEKGMELYFAQDFEQANLIFKNIFDRNTEDLTALLFLAVGTYETASFYTSFIKQF